MANRIVRGISECQIDDMILFVGAACVVAAISIVLWKSMLWPVSLLGMAIVALMWFLCIMGGDSKSGILLKGIIMIFLEMEIMAPKYAMIIYSVALLFAVFCVYCILSFEMGWEGRHNK